MFERFRRNKPLPVTMEEPAGGRSLVGPADEPLIWTKYGLIPVGELTLRMERQDDVDQIVLVECYDITATGEEVKRSPHVLPLAPWQTGKGGRLEQMTISASAASLPGASA